MKKKFTPRTQRPLLSVTDTHRRPTGETPQDEAAEAAVLQIIIQEKSSAEQEALLSQLKQSHFYDLARREMFRQLSQMRQEGHAVDEVTVYGWIRDKFPGKDNEGFRTAAQELYNTANDANAWNFHEYLATLKNKALRRWTLAKRETLATLATAEDLTLAQLRAEFSEILEQTDRADNSNRPRLKIWKANDLKEHVISTHLALVGDNEITMGYDGVVVLAGPGSSGKSLCTASLALAGAIGKGLWMGRKVHRKFKTLIIQAENGTVRLKKEIEALAKNHPGVDINGHIFFSEPPEGGLPFHNADFRAAVKRAVLELEPDLVVVDPWSQVATEDAAKEVVDKLAEIRSCFPAGDECPGLMIVAHTSKPRPENVRKGRGLAYMVSGSVALPNTARCVYVLLPWSEEMTDDRIYWSCPKLNNGEMYAPSVWHRRFGTFFEHDPNTDPSTYGTDEEREERRAVTSDDLKEAFGDQENLTKAALVRRLEKLTSASAPTIYRAITKGPQGYLADLMETTPEKWLKLKKGKAEK